MTDITTKPHPIVNALLLTLNVLNILVVLLGWALSNFAFQVASDSAQARMNMGLSDAALWIAFILAIAALVVFGRRNRRYTTRLLLGLYGLQLATLVFILII